MHWLHLPAGRIPAFLNKAHTQHTPLPPHPSSSSADLAAPHHHYFLRCLDGNSLSDVATWSHRAAQKDTPHAEGMTAKVEDWSPQKLIIRKKRESEMDYRMWERFFRAPWTRWFHLERNLIWKREGYQNQTAQSETQQRCQYFSLREHRCALLQ